MERSGCFDASAEAPSVVRGPETVGITTPCGLVMTALSGTRPGVVCYAPRRLVVAQSLHPSKQVG